MGYGLSTRPVIAFLSHLIINNSTGTYYSIIVSSDDRITVNSVIPSTPIKLYSSNILAVNQVHGIVTCFYKVQGYKIKKII